MGQNQPDIGQFIGMTTEALKNHDARLDKHDIAHKETDGRVADLETKMEVSHSAQAIRYGFYSAIISGLLGVLAATLAR